MRINLGTPNLHRVEEAARAGEALIIATKHPLLRRIHRSNVIRWILSGRLCALRIGRSYYTTDNLVRECLSPPLPPTIQQRHQAAMERLGEIVNPKA